MSAGRINDVEVMGNPGTSPEATTDKWKDRNKGELHLFSDPRATQGTT